MNQGTILGNQIGKWITLAVLVAVLAALLTAGVIRSDGHITTIEYAENGTDPVATFTATDPEGATPIAWALLTTGTPGDIVADDYADAADFMIDSEDGVLKFNIADANDGSSPGSPDFENPQGGSPASNTYNVVVVACDVALEAGACPASPDGQAGYHKVTVKVTNVAETGKVTWTVDPDGTGGLAVADVNGGMPIMQFQVGAILEVAADGGVTDGDVSGATKNVTERLQWYRSSSKTGMGAAIENATGATYTVTTDDIGMYLRVDAFYNVGTGREESASRTSDYPVLVSRTSNDAPEFDPASVTREVSEGKKGMTVGAPVTATDDISNALNYALSGGADQAMFKIDQKTGQITTMVDLDYDETDPSEADQCTVRNSCVVEVTATDSAGAASSPVATVTIKITNVDEKPTFTSGFKMRDVAEGMTQVDNDTDATNDPADEAIYTAMDPDGQRVTYDLMGADGAKFNLSSARALSFKMKPDYEMPTDANKDNVYEVTVRASDGTMYADRMVMVKVTNVDEAPEVMGKDSVNYAENGEDAVATFTAKDPEGATPITWALLTTGTPGDIVADDYADAADFMIDSEDGVLKFNIADANDGSSPGSPDFENPQGAGTPANNTYNVVVVACDMPLETGGTCPAATDPAENAGYHKVTVKVTNVAETGKVTWTTDANADGTADDPTLVQFQVGSLLTATAMDGDITGATKTFTDSTATGVSGVTWRWYRGSTRVGDGEDTSAADYSDNDYTVTSSDVGSSIRVEAFYTVGTGREESASLTSDYPVLRSRSSNEAPEFDPASVTREVNEGKKGMTVGAPVTATDDITNALTYTLSTDGTNSPDNAKFKIDQKTGQITTMVDLDRETTTDADPAFGCGTNYECVVQVIATDSAGAASDPVATVTITLKNVDEKPEFTSETTAMSPKAIRRAEGMTALADSGSEADVTYEATDPDGLNVNLTLMGADEPKFSLSAGGVLSFREKPDYEMPADANKDNVYEVTVRASDGTLNEDRMVKVTVINVDEAPDILRPGLLVSGPRSQTYAENGTDAVGTYTASGSQADSARWTLEGDDAGDFRLSSYTGMSTMLMFSSPPNYEMPMDADTDNTYMVTVKASYGSGADMGMHTQDVTVYVTNEKEDGMVTLSSMSPVVDEEVTATLTDPDGGVMGTTWQWSKSMDSTFMDGTEMDIADATSMAYTPMEADEGYYLMVEAMYTDGYGDDTAMAKTTSAVVSNRAPMFAETMTTREVEENSAAGTNVGAPVTATDPDEGDTLSYMLSGDDAMYFTIDNMGQIKVGADTMLDYETKMSYMVTVKATDPDGESASIAVTINVTDVDENPLLTQWDANENGVIDRGEAIAALSAYLAGETTITRAEAIAVLTLYLSN